jgi:hypothetical protein
MNGSCLCGAVALTAPDHTEVAACHCGMCRRWSGGPLLAVHCGQNVTVTGMENVTVFKSSDWAERGFCARCGTHLFYRLVQANEYVVPVGLFGDGLPFEFKEQIFTDHKPDYYEFANRTTLLTEAEVFAKYV